MTKILIIDDEKYRQDWLFAAIERGLSIETRSALDADQALEQMRETQFDLAFFDHDLGYGMNGALLAREVLENPEKYKCPRGIWIHSQDWPGTKHIQSKFTGAGVRVHVQEISSCMAFPKDFAATVLALLAGTELPIGTGE